MTGYWPATRISALNSCGFMHDPYAHCVRLPSLYEGAGSVNYCDKKIIGGDEYARAAMEAMRDSYHTMPTSNVHEFVAFFSKKNFEHLENEIKTRSGYNPDREDLFGTMMSIFAMVAPRTDVLDVERRLDFSLNTITSYVRELNKHVLDRCVEETKQAHKLWDYYAKNRNGPSEMPDITGIDTRTRLVGSFYAADYWLPDD